MRRRMKKTHDDGYSYKALRKHQIETCEFCDRKFKNRFESIVHNASHIIIPLIKQSFLICDICNLFIDSQDDLNTHRLIKHPEVFIKKEAIIINEASPKIEKPTGLSDSEDISSVITEPIKNRLKFEDDNANFNEILKDLVTECKVNVPICDPWVDGVTKCYEVSDTSKGLIKPIVHVKFKEEQSLIDKLVLDDPLTDEYAYDNFVQNESNQNIDSHNFSALVKPGIFNCRYCFTSFPNRYSLIQHEVVHMKISKDTPMLCLHCDTYIAGNHNNLSKHINKYHWAKKNISTETKNCEKCGFKYRKYHRHLRKYHTDCAPQNDGSVKLLKCCDLCISFFKCTNNVKYIIKGSTKDELGVRYPCEFCGKLYFELKIVQRLTKNLSSDKERKRKTNEERLKMIQHRFKKLNLLSKF